LEAVARDWWIRVTKIYARRKVHTANRMRTVAASRVLSCLLGVMFTTGLFSCSALDPVDIPDLSDATDDLMLEYPNGKIPTVQEAVRGSELIQLSSSTGGTNVIEDTLSSNTAATIEDDDNNDLPFYCHPPNPCPKGFTTDSGCRTDVPDTIEAQKAWIITMQDAGQCSCDQEHMRGCPVVQSPEEKVVKKEAFAI